MRTQTHVRVLLLVWRPDDGARAVLLMFSVIDKIKARNGPYTAFYGRLCVSLLLYAFWAVMRPRADMGRFERPDRRGSMP